MTPTHEITGEKSEEFDGNNLKTLGTAVLEVLRRAGYRNLVEDKDTEFG